MREKIDRKNLPTTFTDDTHRNLNALIGDGGKNKIDSVFAHVLTSNDFVTGRIDRRRDTHHIDPE